MHSPCKGDYRGANPWTSSISFARVVELADTLALEASGFGRAGSNPASGTIFKIEVVFGNVAELVKAPPC